MPRRSSSSRRATWGGVVQIVVSGTHASGKSTLIHDFALLLPDFVVLPDPFESIDEAWDTPTPASFAAQLRIPAERLVPDTSEEHRIAERGPLDFLAHLLALEDLAGASSGPGFLERSASIARDALQHVDLLVVLPITTADGIEPGADEHLELRDAMNDVLLDLIDDSHVVGERAEIVGDRDHRLAVLEALVAGA